MLWLLALASIAGGAACVGQQAAGPPVPVTATLNTSAAIHVVGSYFVGATSSPPWGQKPALQRLASALQPSLVRAWGLAGPGKDEAALLSNLTWWHSAGYSVLLNVAPAVDHRGNVSFDMDALRRTLELLRDNSTAGPIAIELGNEPNCYGSVAKGANTWWFQHGMEVMANYYHEARALLDSVYANATKAKPLLTGPGSSFTGDTAGLCGWHQDWQENLDGFRDFLSRAGHTLEVVSWHFYPGCGGCGEACPTEPKPHPSLVLNEKTLQPGPGRGLPYLDVVRHYAPAVIQAQRELAPNAVLWNTETSSFWDGGVNHLSNAVASGFWFLDELGYLARTHDAITRQIYWPATAEEGCSGYELLALDAEGAPSPRPDFFVAALWRQLMGQAALDVAVNGTDRLRLYAHCGQQAGWVVLAYVNTLPEPVALDLGAVPTAPRVEFALTFANLTSGTLLLNETPLKTLSDMHGKLVSSGPLVVPGHSYGFVQLNAAAAPACPGFDAAAREPTTTGGRPDA